MGEGGQEGGGWSVVREDFDKYRAGGDIKTQTVTLRYRTLV